MLLYKKLLLMTFGTTLVIAVCSDKHTEHSNALCTQNADLLLLLLLLLLNFMVNKVTTSRSRVNTRHPVLKAVNIYIVGFWMMDPT